MRRDNNLILRILQFIAQSNNVIVSVSEQNFDVSSDVFLHHYNMLKEMGLIKHQGYQPGYLCSLTSLGNDYLDQYKPPKPKKPLGFGS